MRLRSSTAAWAVVLAAAVAVPADPAKADSSRNSQWYLRSLRVSEAQKVTKGIGITVAVIDTGVFPHPDLKRNLIAGTSVVPGSNGDGRVDNAGHGTNMAALIAAHGRTNQDGVLGIAPEAKILPVKFTDSGSSAPSAAMANGVEWANANGANVINVSAETGPAFALVEAVQAAIKDNIVVVAGAGNTSAQAIIAYPAAIEGVLVVGSTDRNDKHASFSVKDAKVQICAPGVGITTAEPQSRYANVDGTSASTAIVSGAAALVRAKYPQLSAAEVIHRLTATADDIGPPGRDPECGFGELNIVKALTADVPPLEKASTSAAATGAAGSAGSVAPGYIDPGATTADVEPQAQPSKPASSSTPLVLGILAGLVVAAGVIAVLVIRRRRSF
jgi:type VII secretion-associated serine protease mycosin